MSNDVLLSYYGDDFTGSTDVMEALSSGGLPTVLYTGIPDSDQAARFSSCRAVGIAGISRSQPPDWMDRNLPETFGWLKALNARYCHYKTCSTFDSSPTRGSIGRALEIGLQTFGQKRAAMIVGAPQLRRYTCFGQLFAAYRDKVYRIDRHPVMSVHPATPMREADLLMHLAQQTDLATACLDPERLGKLLAGTAGATGFPGSDGSEVRCVLIDVYDAASQRAAGSILDLNHDYLGPFVIGSSGIEYALLESWRESGLARTLEKPVPLEKLERIAVVSGSCSPTTERQIDAALADGFAGIPVDYQALVSGQGVAAVCEAALAAAAAALEAGKSPLLHTARGPESLAAPAGRAVDAIYSEDAAGRALGRILNTLIERYALQRVIVAGGDTSSHALSEMNVFALTLRHPIPETPGSPVCNAYRHDGRVLELALKGGQIGGDDYFIRLRDGALPSG
jgi:uncharacterized protein YgbK (DUF1537 family)